MNAMSMSKPRCAGMHSREKLMKSRDELDRLAQLNRDAWQVWPIVPSARSLLFPIHSAKALPTLRPETISPAFVTM
jgi:hypothetical protein